MLYKRLRAVGRQWDKSVLMNEWGVNYVVRCRSDVDLRENIG